MNAKAAIATKTLESCIGDKGTLERRCGAIEDAGGMEGLHIRPAARRDIVSAQRDIDLFRDAYRFQTTQVKVSLYSQSNL